MALFAIDTITVRVRVLNFALYSETNPNNYKAYKYIEHWNGLILLKVTEAILAKKYPAHKSGQQ